MIVAILGMHRSGTSAITHMLQVSGLHIGNPARLLEPHPISNPDGFWEHSDFVKLNDHLLARRGGDWKTPPMPLAGWFDPAKYASEIQQAQALMQQLAEQPNSGWKDPRTILNLEFWRHVNPDLRFVLCLRNPLEVAQSLQYRRENANPNSPTYDAGLTLWETVHHSLLMQLPAREMLVTHYESYFYNAYEELKRVHAYLGIESAPEQLQQAASIIKTSGRHNFAIDEMLDEERITDSLRQQYATLCASAGDVYERMKQDTAYQTASLKAGIMQAARQHKQFAAAQAAIMGERDATIVEQHNVLEHQASVIIDQHAVIEQQATIIDKHRSGSVTAPLRFIIQTTSRSLPRPIRQGMKLIWWTVTLQLRSRIQRDRQQRHEVQLIAESGLFDEAWYRAHYPDTVESELSPIWHYLRFGADEDRNPGPDFDTRWYKSTYPDVAVSGMNPLLHYILYGRNEWRRPRGKPTQQKNARENNADPTSYSMLSVYRKKHADDAKPTIVFLGHDAFQAGAQIVLLEIIRWVKKKTDYDVRIMLGEGGSLLAEFSALGPTLVYKTLIQQMKPQQIEEHVRAFIGDHAALIYANTAVTGRFLHVLPDGIPIITHIHELESSLLKDCHDYMNVLVPRTSHFIAVSDRVQQLLRYHWHVSAQKITTIYPFTMPTQQLTLSEPRQKIVYGCGTVTLRKGFDLFVEVAKKVALVDPDAQFIWMGHAFPDFPDPGAYIVQQGAAHCVRYAGEHPNPREMFANGRVFALTSREDPFPLVALEAAECELAIIAFADAGGIPAQLIGQDAGGVVQQNDTDAMAAQVLRVLQDDSLRQTLGQHAHSKYEERFTVNALAPTIMDVIGRYVQPRPAVSVIVPSYNHAAFLRERLDSVYQQTFQDFEVILIDDGSSDASLAILQEYAERYRNRTRLIVNTPGTGSPFAVWEQGIQLAQADLIWIAESDDRAKNTLLESLLPYFDDSQVQIAYCESVAIDETGKSLYQYRDQGQVSPSRWNGSYLADAAEEINACLGSRNTIPNASAVLFRRFDITAWAHDWRSARYAGDWAFYVHTLAASPDSRIAYHASALNDHRRHTQTTIHRALSDPHSFQEFVAVHRLVLDRFAIEETARINMRRAAHEVWNNHPIYQSGSFDALYQSMLGTQTESA